MHVTISKSGQCENLFLSFVIYTSTVRRPEVVSPSQNSSMSWLRVKVFFG